MARLIIVPTPIGNLEDITFRSVKVLKEAEFILSEDTRVTKRLTRHYDIGTPLYSYHSHNEHRRLPQFIERIKDASMVAVVSDAGTPGISDPAFLLIREAIKEGIEVECLPGATALIPALVKSGLPCDRFLFDGFLPHKKGRAKRIAELAKEKKTVILYESPMRLVKTLSQLADSFSPQREAAVIRELSKVYEEVKRGTLKDLESCFSKKTPKGEIVLVIKGRDPKSDST